MGRRSDLSKWPKSPIIFLSLTLILQIVGVDGTECWKRKYTLTYFGIPVNNTLKCPMSFQWTVSDFCCSDHFETPYCCYSETYKLALAVGFICLILLGSSMSLFCCWVYNIPHHILYIFTCRKFHLNDWLAKAKNGPYVDPSFYSGEPFWAPGSDMQPYPLRPMPPRIFYPAPPPNMKFRWDQGHGEMPLFVLASRQFHRNPYSARPHDRTHPHQNAIANALSNQSPSFFSSFSTNDSRRSSVVTLPDKDAITGSRGISSSGHRPSNACTNTPMPMPFKITVDEVEAATELMEAIRMMEEKLDTKDFKGTWDVSDILGETNNTSFITAATNCDNSSYNNYNITNNTSTSSIPTSGDQYQQPAPSSSMSSSNFNALQQHQQIQQHMNINMNSSNRGGGKMSLEIMNHQLSSSLGLNLNNLSNVHVIGNFGGNAMETIAEDDGALEDDDVDYGSPPLTPPMFKANKTLTANVLAKVKPKTDELPRISSALDRIVTRARAEVPFRPSLPGAIPENSNEESDLKRKSGNPIRRNSAPVNF